MLAEQRVVLEQEPVSGVWIEDELGVGQALRQDKRVHGRDDQVMAPACDQDRVRNCAHMRVGRACRPTRFGRFKEELEQSVPGWGQRRRVKNRRIEILGALAFARTRPRQDEATNKLGVV